MTTAVDTNVIVSLWDPDPAQSNAARSALEAASARGGLVICAPVFAELMAAPGRTERFLDSFVANTGLYVDWTLREAVWRTAGRAFQAYAARRKKHGSPRRILADFLIGAHALEGGHRLLTLDDHLYSIAFSTLALVRV